MTGEVVVLTLIEEMATMTTEGDTRTGEADTRIE